MTADWLEISASAAEDIEGQAGEKPETRNERLSVKLTPSMLRRLEKVSERLSINSVTCAAVAIGAWVVQQEQAERMQVAVVDRMAEILEQVAEQTAAALPPSPK